MKMNGIVAVCVGAFLCTVSCNAAVTAFAWNSSANEARNASGANLAAGKTLITFVSTADASINWTDQWVDGTDAGRFGARGDDVVLISSKTTGVTGGRYNTATVRDPAATYLNNNVYGILLDLSYGSTVSDGTYYDLMSGVKGPLADRIQGNGTEDTAQIFTDGLLQTISQVHIVPEPGTFALAAMGVGLIVGIRRRSRLNR